MIEYRKYIEGEVTSHNVDEYGGKSITSDMKSKMLEHMARDANVTSAISREVNNLALDSMIETGVLWSKTPVDTHDFYSYARLGAHKRVLPLAPISSLDDTKREIEIIMPTLEIITHRYGTYSILMVNRRSGQRQPYTFLSNVFYERQRLELPTGETIAGFKMCLGNNLYNKATRARGVRDPRYGLLGLLNDVLGANPNADLSILMGVEITRLEAYLVDLMRRGVITPEAVREMSIECVDKAKGMPRIATPESYDSRLVKYEMGLLTLHMLGKYLPFDDAADLPFHIMTQSADLPTGAELTRAMISAVTKFEIIASAQ